MKLKYLWFAAFLFGSWLETSSAFAATPSASASLLKAKQEAEAKGYVFHTSRDEIVERAKKEGKLRVFSSQEPPSIKAMAAAFKQKYPFIDVQANGVDRPGELSAHAVGNEGRLCQMGCELSGR